MIGQARRRGDRRKQLVYFDADDLTDLRAQAARLDRSISGLMQLAWTLARDRMRHFPSSPLRMAPVLLVVATLACSGPPDAIEKAAPESAADTAARQPPQPVKNVKVQPSTATVPATDTKQFRALTVPQAVTVVWSTTNGTIDANGLYTAPASAGTATVTATAVAAPSIYGTANVTIVLPTPVVTISPDSAISYGCATQQFTATATRGTVSWAMQESAGCGFVSTTGLYTAPDTSANLQCHVIATGSLGGSAVAVVTVSPTRILSVGVSPANVNLQTLGTAQFTATVTSSCGVSTTSVALAQ